MFVLEKLKEYAKTGRAALLNREERLSYAELDARSEAFAAWLLARFGEDRTPVVIYGEKETDFLCCIFGALKSGRGYVPIDRSVPPERAARIVADVNPRVTVDFGGLGVQDAGEVLEGRALGEILSCPGAAVPPENWISGDTTAYILFTSGSTGRPKGVPITAANLAGFCRGLRPYYPEEGGVILHQISYSFDVSGCAVYGGLSRGMTLFTVDRAMVENIGLLFAWLQSSRLSFWVSTPSFAELCIQSPAFTEKLLPNLGRFLFCGEVLTHTLCAALAKRFPGARVINTYGPTEATVLVTAVEVTEALRRDSRPIPIGRPIEGAVLRLEDGGGREITDEDAPGELLILGGSVGPGYLGRPDLTKKAFFTDPAVGMRGYRTGDICYRKDGLYYYCGRADNQLKLNGFRVEPEDVENNLSSLPNIARAAVVPFYAEGKARYLAAFLLLEHPDKLSNLKRAIEVKRRLAEKLPAYMIPRKVFTVDVFPLGVSGKIDKKALAERLEGNGP